MHDSLLKIYPQLPVLGSYLSEVDDPINKHQAKYSTKNLLELFENENLVREKLVASL